MCRGVPALELAAWVTNIAQTSKAGVRPCHQPNASGKLLGAGSTQGAKRRGSPHPPLPLFLYFVDSEVIGLYQALYRKWRPRTFDSVVGQAHITDTLKRQVAAGRLSHAYLFTGTRGTGKTTCAKLLARAVNCEHPMDGNPCNQCSACLGIESGSILDVLELDAASNNGVDQVRALRDEAVYTPAAVKKRVYIIDEVHMLSMAAFNALLKILEEPPAHLMFILATTELNKVPATIRSRCQQFAFKRILPSDIARRLSYVSEQEGLELSGDGAALLARLADGGLRDALSLLDQCVNPSGRIGEQEILDALGLAGNLETAGLMEQIGGGDTAGVLERFSRLYGAGKEIGSLLHELAALTRDLLIRKTAPKGGAILLTGGYEEAVMRRLSRLFSAPRLIQMLERLQETAANLSRSGDRRTDAELCLIRLCDETLDASLAGLNARLSRLEEQAAIGRPAPESKQSEPLSAAKPDQAEPPVPSQTDLPPWEEADCPPMPEEPGERIAPEPPRSDPAPMQEPKKQAPASNSQEQAFWNSLVPDLRGSVPMGVYPFLTNPAMVQGRLDGSVLTLWVESDFTRNMMSKPAVLEAISKTAAVRLGRPVRCTVRIGQPPAGGGCVPAGARDKLDDLIALGAQLGGIVTEEL